MKSEIEPQLILENNLKFVDKSPKSANQSIVNFIFYLWIEFKWLSEPSWEESALVIVCMCLHVSSNNVKKQHMIYDKIFYVYSIFWNFISSDFYCIKWFRFGAYFSIAYFSDVMINLSHFIRLTLHRKSRGTEFHNMDFYIL